MSFLLVKSEFCSDYFLNVFGQAFFSLALGALCLRPEGPTRGVHKKNSLCKLTRKKMIYLLVGWDLARSASYLAFSSIILFIF